MKKYLAVTICALSAAAAVTACSAGDRNDKDYKAGRYEESSAVTTTRPAVTSRAETKRTASSKAETTKTTTSSRRDISSSVRDTMSSRRDDSDGLASRVGEGLNDVVDGGEKVIDDTLDTGRDVIDDIFR